MRRLVEITADLLVATSRREHTTSSVIPLDPGHGDGSCLLVDPCWDPDELSDLAVDLADRGLVVAAGLATHAHYDHLLWHPDFGEAPRWASADTARLAARDHLSLLAALGSAWPDDLAAVFGQVERVPSTALRLGGQEVELLVHDGHEVGHTAAWFPDLAVLIAGDMLSDIELPLPAAGPSAIADYAAGLDLLAPFIARAAWVVPGHGTPTRHGRERLDADRRYLDAIVNRRRPDDDRLTNPGMEAVHRTTVDLAP